MRITKFIVTITLLLLSVGIHSQIYTPTSWEMRIEGVGEESRAVFTATIESGWHLYDMDLPDGGPVSTLIEFTTVKGVELLGEFVASQSPTKVYDSLFGMEVRWYSSSVTFTRRLRITDYTTFRLAGEVEFMSCNDEICTPPDRIPFSFDSRHITSPSSPSGDALTTTVSTDSVLPAEAELPASGLSEVGTSSSDAFAESASPGQTIAHPVGYESALWTPVIEELRSFGGGGSAESQLSWLYIFLAGFLGGLVALMTPCVWPVIPMTVSFFLKRSGSRGRAISDALLYSLSVVVIYLILGLLVTGIFGASALNELATNAVFNVIFFLMLIFFAISFFGAFELMLPSSWTNAIDAKADSSRGILSIFFMAFTLALVSFSCTGPIIGTLLVEAASEGMTVGPVLGMLGFSLALAIPFGLFAIFPSVMQRLPRSGGWLQSVKVVLGFLELALSLKFLSVADLAYGWGILDREVFLVLWIVIFVLLGAYLLGKLRFEADDEMSHITVPRLFLSLISLSFALYLLPGLWGAPLKSVSAFAPPLHTQDFSLYEDVRASFDDYESGLAYARRVGKPVLLDFSGYGCVNCRKMEAAVWTDSRVKQLLEESYVLISLMVDDRAKLPEPIEIKEAGRRRTLRTIGDKWSYLQRHKFGSNAQPFYVLIDGSGRLLSGSYAYDEDVQRYVDFLESGINEFKKLK